MKDEESSSVLLTLSILYQMIHPLTTLCLIPIIVLGILNYNIVKGSQRITVSRLKPELSLYKVMMMVVVVFILTSIPRTSLALYEVTTLPNIITCQENSCR